MREVVSDVTMVVVPFPAQGHLNQLLHFSRLVSAHDIPVHFVGSETHNRQAKTRLNGWRLTSYPTIRFHSFPIPSFQTPPPDPTAPLSHLIPAFDASLHIKPHLSRFLSALSATHKRVILVHDSLMAFAAQETVGLPNTETYTFHSVSAFANFFFQHETRGTVGSEWRRRLPGVPVVTGEGCFTEEFLGFVRRQHKLTTMVSDGRIINTCWPIEGEFIDLFAKEPILHGKPLFAVGPLNPCPIVVGKGNEALSGKTCRHVCLDWLDEQPRESVMYVSFGTTSALKSRQIDELAAGLERSQHRFLWVLREADRGDIFAAKTNIFDNKIAVNMVRRGKGIVVAGVWAPQVEILAHKSIGGFLSHCGWNSCMESMSSGVPILTFPVHSDQPRNAVLLTRVLRVGLTLREWAPRPDIVTSDRIQDAIRRLMATEEGMETRKRAKSLAAAIHLATTKKGGARNLNIDSFISHITRP